MGKKGKRKTSFLRKLYEKLNPSAPIEADDPGEEVSVVEENPDQAADVRKTSLNKNKIQQKKKKKVVEKL